MSKKWTTSDLHFNHASIIKYCPKRGNSVDEMNETIIRNFNSVVSPEDETIFVGDIAMGIVANAIPLIRCLNGKKVLVLGNHDKTLKKLLRLQENSDIFIHVSHQYELTVKVDEIKTQIVFSHFPYSEWAGNDRGTIHLHGHLHREGDERFITPYRQMDVGIDGGNMFPYDIDNLVREMRKRPTSPHRHTGETEPS